MKTPSHYPRSVCIFFLISVLLGIYLQWDYYRIGLNWDPTFSGFPRFMFALLLVLILTLWVLRIVFQERKHDPLWRVFLKLLGGLLLPLAYVLFYTSVRWIGMDRYLKGLHDRLDQTCAEQELRDWSETIRNTYKGRKGRITDELDFLPVCLAELLQERSKPLLILEQDGRLILGWSDFGSSMYGITFCKQSAKVQPNETLRRLEWKPGIDVFSWPEE